MGEMRVMGQRGDTKIIWDADNDAEVSSARATFNRLREQRFLAFSVAKTGEKGERIGAFDPDAEKLIMVPPMAGGA
jgi:hypothetical protein